ncbi:hypothetical protein JW824_06645 [bacterium]|nr:hypothetical protein [bacterium]RQV95546.1 MAG: hypothetical protein EH221_06135 [bacterium]
MESANILLVLKRFIKVLDELSISYYIGGSIASSVFGLPRATMDIDIIADVQTTHIPHLKERLERDFYIDKNMIKEAIHRSSSFNLIHLETAMKIDVFIPQKDRYNESVNKRKLKDTLIEGDKTSEFYFSSPEDIILNKLKWYEMGKRVSERQWLDIIGVIKVQEDSLNKDYLKSWAEKLGVSELLVDAFNEADVKM